MLPLPPGEGRGEGRSVPKAPAHHPLRELLARYAAIFRAVWQHRHELAGPDRLADEAAFLPAALSLQDTPVHPAPRRLAFALIALFLIALAWAVFGHVDIVAVAPGRIQVSERTKVIQPLEVSVVKRVLVKDGDHVEAGQALVELDPTGASADKTNVDEQLKSAQAELLRTRTLQQALMSIAARDGASASVPDLLPKLIPKDWNPEDAQASKAQLAAEWSDIMAKLGKSSAEIARRQAEIATVQAMVAKLETTLPIARQREADFKQLADQGFMSSHANQDRTRERIELERDLATQHARLLEAHATLRESENTRAAYLAETRRSLREREAAAELKRSQGMQDHTKAAQREKLTTLAAPVGGMVQQLAMHTEGGVVTEAQPIMVIVPDGASLTAEVTLENKDTYVVDAAGDVVTELANEGTELVQSSVSYTLAANVENLTLTGTTAINATGNTADNVLTGNSGANILTGNAGNDILDGRGGADTMRGGIGDDTYYADNASDVVTELAGEGTDTVISTLTRTLAVNVENLRLNAAGAINATGNTLDNVLFAGAGNNVLNGLGGADTASYLYASAGVTVSLASTSAQSTGGSGSDTLQNIENLTGSGFNDTLTGSTSANRLQGGLGNDVLNGGAGSDAYLLGRGEGADTINESDATAGDTDLALFGSGIATDQLWFRQAGHNLEISVIGGADKFTVTNWYLGSQYHVEQFRTSDGKTLLDSQVQNLVQAMAGFAPPAAGQTTLPTNYQSTLNTVIAANWH